MSLTHPPPAPTCRDTTGTHEGTFGVDGPSATGTRVAFSGSIVVRFAPSTDTATEVAGAVAPDASSDAAPIAAKGAGSTGLSVPRVVAAWWSWDPLLLLEQLGAGFVPPPKSAPSNDAATTAADATAAGGDGAAAADAAVEASEGPDAAATGVDAGESDASARTAAMLRTVQQYFHVYNTGVGWAEADLCRGELNC